ncbi:MAG: sugar phosphate nucleotidyltransferase [Patescibacteria group bacterium]|nr:sugar phosphate nucleotidyltransferase [Patescibacteria group bacterium]
MKNITAVILAAGKGTRLKSKNKNKVVRKINHKPMICYTVDLLKNLGLKEIIVVVGFKKSSVINTLGNNYTYVVQNKILGTGHALKTALPAISKSTKNILVLQGDDTAFYDSKDIKAVIATHTKTKADMTILTVIKKDPNRLGRIIRDKNNQVKAIVEFKNANHQQKQIKEINTATYCFNHRFLKKYLKTIKKNPISKEYYLTDLLEIAIKHQKKVSAIKLKDSSKFQGINTLEELKISNRKMKNLA